MIIEVKVPQLSGVRCRRHAVLEEENRRGRVARDEKSSSTSRPTRSCSNYRRRMPASWSKSSRGTAKPSPPAKSSPRSTPRAKAGAAAPAPRPRPRRPQSRRRLPGRCRRLPAAASPAARKILDEKGIAADVSPFRPGGGRVTKEDAVAKAGRPGSWPGPVRPPPLRAALPDCRPTASPSRRATGAAGRHVPPARPHRRAPRQSQSTNAILTTFNR